MQRGSVVVAGGGCGDLLARGGGDVYLVVCWPSVWAGGVVRGSVEGRGEKKKCRYGH